MKRVVLPSDAEISGQPASPQIKLTDISKQGSFARDNVGAFIRDIMLKASSVYGTMGGQFSLAAGLQIDIFPPLAIYRQADGRGFYFYSDVQTTITIDDADADNPRIDLIVATLFEDSAQHSTLRHFRQTPPNPGQPEGDINAADEIWDYCTISAVTGSPNASPSPPALPANSVLLYTITVPAAATALTEALIADNREGVLSQEAQDELIAELLADINDLKSKFHLPLSATQVIIEPGAGPVFSGLTEQEAWQTIGVLADEQGYDPITRPETLTANGKLGGIPNQESSNPVVDIPLGLRVAFSNVIRKITQNDIPASLNPRIVNLSGSAGTDTDTKDVSPLTLGSILSIESDGAGAFQSKSALCPSKRQHVASAARDGRYIENYGGGTASGGALSDWFTYDTVSDVVIPRTLTGVIPPASRLPQMFSCGDDRHILLAAVPVSFIAPRWFLIDTTTWISTELSGGPTTTPDGPDASPYRQFIGDLIQANIILICAVGQQPNSNAAPIIRTFWTYDVAGNTFTQLSVTGSIPSGGFADSTGCDACLYQQGKLVLFQENQRRTYLFDYGTLTWTSLNLVEQPRNFFGAAGVSRFRMVNIGGKPILFGGTDDDAGILPQQTSNTAFWVLTPSTAPQWQAFTPAGLPRLWNIGGASLISGGLPKGSGFAFGGLDPGIAAGTDKVYAFAQGGVVETLCDGVVGLTLAPGTRQAVIRVADYQVALSGAVVTEFLSLRGCNIAPGSVAVSVSLNDGVSFQDILPDHVTTILASSNPGHRQLKITMFSSGSSAPIITGIHEVFEKTGGPALSQAYIRFNVLSGTRALYIKRDGTMEVITSINPTTPDEGILLKMTHNGSGVNPSVKNYVNQRRILVQYSAVKGGSNPQFDYDGGVAPAFIRAYGVTGGATGAMYKIANPTIAFDGTVTVTGLATSADFYYVEAEA